MRQFSGNNRKRSDSGNSKPFGKKRFEKPDYKPRKSYSDSDKSSEFGSPSNRKPRDGDDSKEKRFSTFSHKSSSGESSRFRSDDKKNRSEKPNHKDSHYEGYSSRSNSERGGRYRSEDNGGRPKQSNSTDSFRKRDTKSTFGDSERRPYLSKTRYMGDNSRSDDKSDREHRDSAPNYRTKTKPVYDERISNATKADDGTMRLNKFISNAGICSRREADELILSGKVKVNGQIITELGVKVQLTDTITYKGKTLVPEKKVYILMNKPKDCVTTTDDPEARRTVFDILKGSIHEQLHAVGRLDRNTTGVLLLTNDGELTQTLTHPKFSKSKIYHVWIDRNITESDLKAIQQGIQLDDGFVKPDEVSFVEPGDKTQIGIEIHSGQNRVVRRIFEHFDYKVIKLDRVYFAGLTKKSLPRGEWRFLTNEEVSILKRMSIK